MFQVTDYQVNAGWYTSQRVESLLCDKCHIIRLECATAANGEWSTMTYIHVELPMFIHVLTVD